MKITSFNRNFLGIAVTVIASGSFCAAHAQDVWGTTPLGPNIPKPQAVTAPIKKKLETRLKTYPVSGPKLSFVENGTARAAIVHPQNANSSEKAAAAVLQQVFREMSGTTLPMVADNALNAANYATLISVGNTTLAQQQKISAEELGKDGYRLQTAGNTLFIIGKDDNPATPRMVGGRSIEANGTRNGAYALLERHFGCRWLWPGQAGGEIFPAQKTITLNPLHETDQPALAQRGIRNYYPEKGGSSSGRRQQQAALTPLGKSYTQFVRKATKSGEWFQAMRLGTSMELNVGHSYGDYWQKYKDTHPEWFALQADGTRNQDRIPAQSVRAQLCVSNESLIQHVAAEAIRKFDENPELETVSIAPNDGSYPSFCLCEVCRRLDPPGGDPASFSIIDNTGKATRITYVSLTDRYTLFHRKVGEIVAQKYPHKKLGTYAYSTYSSPPHYARLTPNIIISYVGLSYFNEDQRKLDRESWDAWANVASEIQLRPNALLGGYGIPAVFTRKLSEDIKHAYQTGMIGADFDTLTHDWAGRGLNYYVLAKLLWDPSQDLDAIIKDYCDAGFGPASTTIQNYFAALEQLTDKTAQAAADASRTEDGISGVRGIVTLIGRNYTDEAIDNLQAILDKAKEDATGNPAVLKRIEFLEQGLRFARVEAGWYRAYTAPATPEKKQKVTDALNRRWSVMEDIYENHFYAQSIISTYYRLGGMAREYDWAPAVQKQAQ